MINDLILKRFLDKLAPKPYSSDAKGFLKILPKNLAITHRYLQHNTPFQRSYIVLDVDRPFAFAVESKWDIIPAPNLEVRNPANNHVHLFFELETPVFTTKNSHEKPIEYLKAIEFGLIQKFGADISYGGLISKNPLHQDWETTCYRDSPYRLEELAENVDLTLLKGRINTKSAIEALGRNCAIFDSVRISAYRIFRESFLQMRNEEIARRNFFDLVFAAAQDANVKFPQPLNDSEVKAIARSITKFCFEKYNPSLRQTIVDAEFSEQQRQRNLRSQMVRKAKAAEKRQKAQELRELGYTHQQISKNLGISKKSVQLYLKKS